MCNLENASLQVLGDICTGIVSSALSLTYERTYTFAQQRNSSSTGPYVLQQIEPFCYRLLAPVRPASRVQYFSLDLAIACTRSRRVCALKSQSNLDGFKEKTSRRPLQPACINTSRGSLYTQPGDKVIYTQHFILLRHSLLPR